jgi:hypothetical protein
VRSGFTVSKALLFNFLSALVALAGTALVSSFKKLSKGKMTFFYGYNTLLYCMCRHCLWVKIRDIPPWLRYALSNKTHPTCIPVLYRWHISLLELMHHLPCQLSCFTGFHGWWFHLHCCRGSPPTDERPENNPQKLSSSADLPRNGDAGRTRHFSGRIVRISISPAAALGPTAVNPNRYNSRAAPD